MAVSQRGIMGGWNVLEASRQSVSRRRECSLASDTVAHQGRGGPNGPLGFKSGRSTVALRRKALVGRENRWAESLTRWIGKERERETGDRILTDLLKGVMEKGQGHWRGLPAQNEKLKMEEIVTCLQTVGGKLYISPVSQIMEPALRKFK